MNPAFDLVAVAVLFFSAAFETKAKLSEGPSNSTTFVGDTVLLRCITKQTDYPPSWSHRRVGSKESTDVYITVQSSGSGIVGRMMSGYHERFHVEGNTATGNYSLAIKSIKLEDAGQYTCTARGGIGQQILAELVVFESSATCASNATEVLGENNCDREPDHVGLSCSIRVRGNHLPTILWGQTDHPEKIVRTEAAQWNDQSDVAGSTYVIRGDAKDLHGTSFTCIITSFDSSSERTTDSRLRCEIPVINVIEIRNVTESKILLKPEEVECNSLPSVKEKKCKWVKRKLGEETEETVVTESRTLNLYKPELEPGTYVCIIECDIRGQPCSVETLVVTYQPAAEFKEFGGPPVNITLVIIVTVVLTLFCAAAVTSIIFWIGKKKRSGSFTGREGPQTEKTGTNGHEMKPLTGENREQEHRNDIQKKEAEQQQPLQAADYASLDITDARMGKPGDRELRIRRMEEQALARMRANAARQNKEQQPSLFDDIDVAEGLNIGAGQDGVSPEQPKKDT